MYLTKDELDILKGVEGITFEEYHDILRASRIINDVNHIGYNSVGYYMYQILENIVRINNCVGERRDHQQRWIHSTDITKLEGQFLYEKINSLIRSYTIVETIILGNKKNDGYKTPLFFIGDHDQRKVTLLLTESRAILMEVRWLFLINN